MINNSEQLSFYQNRIKELNSRLTALKKRHLVTGWLRLFVFILLVASVIYLWPNGVVSVFLAAVPLTAFFVFLFYQSLRTEENIKNTTRLLLINNEETEILNGQYGKRYDGAIFSNKNNYSDTDLDVFGRASLFQYINRATSEQGKKTLAEYFSGNSNRETIIQKQQAVKELAAMPEWRQQLQAHGMDTPVTISNEQLILSWIRQTEPLYQQAVWQAIRFVLPVISVTVLALHLAGIIPNPPFYLFLLAAFVFSYSISKKITKEYGHLSKLLPELESILPALNTIEQTPFNSSYILEQKTMLQNSGSASAQIARLKKILDRFDYRLNPVVHIPLNIFLLWDLQQALALYQWKKTNTVQTKQWYAVLGEMEALSSLATLHFNRPEWVFPEITDHWFEMECRQLGHPLIQPSKLVLNNFSLTGTPQIALVTGSNMAGKSTFLRTIGANTILAMAGAPVCAKYMKLPVTIVMSSMRITDNLEEETSTFYAELKKLKWILESVQKKEKVFLLLDEMLRGTNSLDRHSGSEALIRQLIREGAVGIIASHDVELSRLEQEFPAAIANYHFDSAVVQEEIIFDYQLKKGICTSTNATLLMRKIGIQMD